MAYGDSNSVRFKRLIRNPRREAGRVFAFAKSRLAPTYRRLLESLGIYGRSKPFSGHDRFLPHVSTKKGFFVQCGGMDGYGNDPTYYLEKALGWSGIIAEPLSAYESCKKNRRGSTVYNVAVGSFDNRGKTVSFVDVFGMSFVKGSRSDENQWISVGETTQGITARTIEVPMMPVQDLIDDYFSKNGKRKIDLFVADVEGYELETLKGLDFKKNSPAQILLESSSDRIGALTVFLKEKKYVLADSFDNDYLFKLQTV